MSKVSITRTNVELPPDKGLEYVREFLFKCFKGFVKEDDARWRRFWKRMIALEPGEMFVVETVFPRSGPYHRRHMAIEQALFDAQERFIDFEQFRYWLKVGSAWVIWAAGPAGGVVPIPKSISYAKADESEFREYHVKVIEFLRGDHAAKYLWRHLDNPHEMMNTILEGFEE